MRDPLVQARVDDQLGQCPSDSRHLVRVRVRVSVRGRVRVSVRVGVRG